jgi:hypothetical protein
LFNFNLLTRFIIDKRLLSNRGGDHY